MSIVNGLTATMVLTSHQRVEWWTTAAMHGATTKVPCNAGARALEARLWRGQRMNRLWAALDSKRSLKVICGHTLGVLGCSQARRTPVFLSTAEYIHAPLPEPRKDSDKGALLH